MAGAEQINNLRGIGDLQEKPKVNDISSRQVVRDRLEQLHPELTREENELVSEMVLSKDRGGEVTINGKTVNTTKIADEVATSLDLDFIDSMQQINSETNPNQEYYRWIDEGIDIIKEMTDGNITDQDISHREEFLTNLDQREIEMKTCIALYQHIAVFGSEKQREQARAKLEFLQVKWAKMLEIRSSIQNSTKDKAAALRDREVSEQEREESRIYLLALYYMRDNRPIPLRIKAKLGLMQGIVFDYSISEELIKKINQGPNTKTAVIDRINALRGRQDPSYKPKLLVEKQNFNSARFFELRRIEEMRQRA